MAWGAVCLMGLESSEQLWAVTLELCDGTIHLYSRIPTAYTQAHMIVFYNYSSPIPSHYTLIIVSRTHPCPSSPVPDPIIV